MALLNHFFKKILGVERGTNGSGIISLSSLLFDRLLLGVCFVAEDPEERNTFGRFSQKQCRSYHP
jgi:hypothetical protein